MATPAVLTGDDDLFLSSSSSIFDSSFKGDGAAKSRGSLIEKKIEILEGLTSSVSNRRARRLLNDRLLMELVPRLNAEEIRGLFAPPPWGDEAPVSAFCMTNVVDWDKFRSIDMDKEASLMKASKFSSSKKKGRVDGDKMAVLIAWHRVDSRAREALRRSFISEFVEGYETIVRAFIQGDEDADVLMLQVQDPFHRLLLHGLCEFYNLGSATETNSKGSGIVKMMSIQKKRSCAPELPNITLSNFLKMTKGGIW